VPTPPVTAALVELASFRRGPGWAGWSTLAAAGAPYLTPEFFTLVAPLAEPGPRLVAAAWQGDAMVGALPLVQVGRRLTALRTDHSPGFDFVGTAAGLDAIWAALRDRPGWDELRLGKLPVDSPLATELAARARADGYPVTIRPDGRHPYLPLPGFFAAMDHKFRANLERCARKAGGVSLERRPVPSLGELEAALAIEAMAWKAAAGTSITSSAEVARLYRVIARLWGRRGRAALCFLRAGDARIATMFALEDDRHVYALKIGYDPSHANLSPGHLLVWQVAADAERRGLRELDFIGREDEWKRKWTDAVHPLVAMIIYRRSPRGLARFYVRERIKPRLPEALGRGLRGAVPSTCQRGLDLTARARDAMGGAAPVPGPASRWPIGAWVRIRAAGACEGSAPTGVSCVPAAGDRAGEVHQVAGHVRQIRDDRGALVAVPASVRLADVSCGCGARCPLIFPDGWLEAAAAPRRAPPVADTRLRARVLDLDEILTGLDLFGRRDGVAFLPSMRRQVGRRLAIAGELPGEPSPSYLLEGIACDGAPRGCDRACPLRWHPSWVRVDHATVET
jgi:hypothetical protein